VSNIHDPDHPAWKILLHAIYLLSTLFCLWLYATEFDETEIKTLMSIAGAVTASGVIKKFVVNHPTTEEASNDS
jgi:hypothetical protein